MCLAHNLALQVLKDGDAHVDLVVLTQKHANADVVTDLRPIEIIPETLANPMLTDLRPIKYLLHVFP